MLEVTGLRKRYGDVEALADVSLRVSDGERFGLLGPNGAGKTTFVSIVATLIPFDDGTATVGGYDVKSKADEVRRLIGYVPQEPGLYLNMSGLYNLEFFGSAYGLRGDDLKRAISDVLEITGLEEHARKRVSTYSGGMRRRLNLAVGLLHRPKLLLLDEPTVGVDPQSRAHILDSIRELNRALGITVIYTTHYMEEAESLCERVAIIDHGRIIVADSVAGLLARLGSAVLSVRLSHATDGVRAKLTSVIPPENMRCGDDGVFHIGVENVGETLPALLRITEEAGVQIEDLQVARPSLEQVFLSLTGRRLRD